MKIGIPREVLKDERRVACTPDQAVELAKLGHDVIIERSAGFAAGYTDPDYEQAGAVIVDQPGDLWSSAEMVLKVQPPLDHPALGAHESTLIKDGKILAGFFWPGQNAAMLAQIAQQGGTVLAMDAVPRISRAQKLDALSSMANIAGYRAVIEAGQHFGRFFTGQITAAGKVPPAKVLVIGAGVAGLSAIGTAVSLGAIVRAFDTRPEVKEQIESMSAEFLMLDFEEDGAGEGGYARVMSDAFIEAEMALFAEQARDVDIIVTTALIPGKPAPKLITTAMVESMKTGSVIVDLAAEQGGNCELTEPGEICRRHGVTIIGYTDFPSRMAAQSSQLYATNLRHLINDLTPAKDGTIVIDMDDEVVRGTTVVHEGAVTWPPPPISVSAAPPPAPPAAEKPAITRKEMSPSTRNLVTLGGVAVMALLILAVGSVAPVSFLNHFIVFVLACFVGWQVIWNVTPALHTPLMSVTNAISSIIVIGALLQTGSPNWIGVALAIFAVLLASINISGGFLVTQRMLKMFQK